MERKEPISDNDLISIIRNEIDEAAGGDDELATNRENAINYFNCGPNGKEIDGRNQSVDSTVADSIEAVMAQTMPLFTNPDVAQFEAVSDMDERQAIFESDACTYIIMNRSNGYLIMQAAIKNALLLRNGIIKITEDEVVKHRTEEYKDLDSDQVMQVLAPTQENEEVNVITREDTPNPLGDVSTNLELTRILRTPTLQIDSIPPSRFRFSSDCRKLDLSDANFCCDISYPKRYELIERGFNPKMVYEIPAVISEEDGTTSATKQTHSAEDEHYASAKAVETVMIYNITMRADYDNDGYAELRSIIFAKPGHILANESTDCIPYAVGSPFPTPDRFAGQSFYDKLKGVQDNKTAVQRQYWDNLNANNNRRLAVDARGLQEPDSILESKPAGVIKCKRPPQEVIMPIPVDDIGPSCKLALDYLDRQRSEKVGASLDMQTQQVQVKNDTAHGAERMISSKEEMAAYILANLCHTLVRQTYLIVHKKLKGISAKFNYKAKDTWHQANAGQWLDREDVTIDPGLSKGEKTVRFNALSTMLEYQKNAFAEGGNGIITDMTKIYNTVSEMVRVSGIGHVGSFWIDPQSQQSQQAQQAKQQQEQAIQQAQQQVQQAQMQLQTALAQAEMTKAQNGTLEAQIKQLKALLDAKDAADDTTFKYDKLFEDNATKLAIANVNAEKQEQAKETIDERGVRSRTATQ